MVNNIKFQRDEFIKEIYKAAKKNKKIYFLSADFGAPALDDFRFKLKQQFLHLGICEQNMVDFACGMALEKNKVYIYAMAPFLVLRCLEQHKTTTCLMDANVCSIITGIGLSYANSGPTHYSTEDFACLRSLPNCSIYTASDPATSQLIAKHSLKINSPTFVRLDRKSGKNFKKKTTLEDVQKGYRFIEKNNSSKTLVINQGTIIERSLHVYNELKLSERKNIDILDLIRAKPFPKSLKNIFSRYNKIITIDEQTSQGSLGSLIKENCVNVKKIISLSLSDTFIFENIGREKLLDKYGLSKNIIKNHLKRKR